MVTGLAYILARYDCSVVRIKTPGGLPWAIIRERLLVFNLGEAAVEVSCNVNLLLKRPQMLLLLITQLTPHAIFKP